MSSHGYAIEKEHPYLFDKTLRGHPELGAAYSFEAVLFEYGERHCSRPGCAGASIPETGSRLPAHIAYPVTARGMQFDGVIVVEPGAFPRNLGRVGPLYTRLTRANN